MDTWCLVSFVGLNTNEGRKEIAHLILSAAADGAIPPDSPCIGYPEVGRRQVSGCLNENENLGRKFRAFDIMGLAARCRRLISKESAGPLNGFF